nr:uncharacterized protein LOC129270827 [Lytechinus pictus]
MNDFFTETTTLLYLLFLMCVFQVYSQQCPDSFIEFGDAKYCYRHGGVPFDSARVYCKEIGGDLTIITSQEQNEFLAENLVSVPSSSNDIYRYWIGLNRNDNGNLRYINGDAPSYTNWVSPAAENDCAFIIGSQLDIHGQWDRNPCSNFRRSICQIFKALPLNSWVPIGSTLYHVTEDWTSRTYNGAKEYCLNLGGSLAQPRSQRANDLLQAVSGSSGVWIGSNDINEEGTYQWEDGTLLGGSSPWWEDGEPTANSGLDCVQLSPNGWRVQTCYAQLRFACQLNQALPLGNWIPFGKNDYFRLPSWLTLPFLDARDYCQTLGGDIAQPKDDQSHDFLQETVDTAFWIGLSDTEEEGTYLWIDGTIQGNSFPPWAQGSTPQPSENNDCVYIRRAGGWSVRECTAATRFVCEKSRAPEPILPIRLTAATQTPFGSDSGALRYLCLLSSPDADDPTITVTTQRLVKLSQSSVDDDLTVPGVNEAMNPDSLPVVIDQSLPLDANGMGVFECKASLSPAGSTTSVSTVILLHSRQYQPADGRFTKSVYPGGNISLGVSKLEMDMDLSKVIWRRFSNLNSLDSTLGQSMGQLHHDVTMAESQDADVYGTYTDGEIINHEQSFIRLIVIGCPEGRWDPPSCLGVCDNCYNGGICHQQSGTCVCPPGFSGKNCLTACGEHRYGWACEFACGSGHPLDQCAGSQICLPDPYGCNCLAGYTGVYCNETCQEKRFGVDCILDCHCSQESLCNPYNGSCSAGCENGWSGPSCQVPYTCSDGYYGDDCAEKCNCLDGRPCDKVTGSCLESEGECAVGYIPDPEGPYGNCRLYSGCYDSCSSTCHCFDGSTDCNSVTGSCFSETCSLRWSGDKCQTDRFSIQTEKTNPGLALVHCMFSSVGQSMPSESINISRNDTFIGQASIIQSNYSTEDNVSRGSFYLESVGPDDILYCTVGLINGTQRPTSYSRIPKREYYVLPELATQPSVSTIRLDQVMVMWRPWTPEKDLGDGPIIGYYIYVRSSDDDVTKEWIPSPQPDQQRTGNSTKSNRMLQNETLHRNITDLQPDSTYSLSLSVVREGLNGEGAEGDEIQFMTLPIPTTVPPTTVPPTTPTVEPGSMSQQNNVTSIAAGCSAGIILVILIVIVIILFVRYRNRKTKTGRRNQESLHYVNTHKTCYEEDGTGMDDLDGNEKDILPYVNMEELSPTDKILQQTANSPGPNPPSRARTSPEKKPVASVEPIAQSDRIPVDEFPAFVQKNRHTHFFKEEFSSLPSGIQYRQTVAERPINAQKNRYKNILPYDAHRVVLAHIDDEHETDYYNASYISNFKCDRAYIAAQGPNTASETDFWRMVWQEKVKTIAMVTNLKEGNKRKCQKYWPNDINHTMQFGPYQVVLKSSVDGAAWVVRHLIIRRDTESHNVCQYHYTEWPDKGVPKHTSSLLMFLREVQAHHGQNETPLLIHCSAGVGRTGVMIGIDGIVGGAKATGFVDVFSFVSNMRQNRPQMVQTAEQYEFLYHAVLEDLLFENTSIPFENFPSYLKGLKELLPGGKQTGLSKQFKNLQVVSPDPPEAMNRTALLAENQSKNRYGNILPLQRNRVILKSRDSEEDYINASFVKGSYFSFITTAMPMTNTARDFWAMIYDYQPSHIVMLNDVHEDKTCEQYWSEKGAITQGCFTITVTSSKRDNNVIRRKLRVQHSKSLVYHDVDQYQLLKWCQDGHYSSLLTIIDQVQESSETLAEPSILVHCLSGVGRTGAFCSVMECIAQIAETGNVDVFQTIKELRVERTHFVQTESDYEDTYMILQDFLCKANTELTPSDNSDMEPTYVNRESVYANTEPQYDNTEYQSDSGNGGHAENRTLLRGQTNAVYENVSFDLHEE